MVVDRTARLDGDVEQGKRGFFDLSRRRWLASAGLVAISIVLIWRGVHRWDDWKFDLDRELALAASVPPVFDLTTSLIPNGEILSGGPPKDGIPALTHPKALPAGEAAYLNDDDRVIGVAFGVAARAYPLRILNWHENINDTLGGQAIAVTYCPLCDSAVVFDRNVAGRVLEFGISGRLYNSNVLLYDRQPAGRKESLWSQLQMRAVTGPAAEKGLTLSPLPAELTSWGAWRERFPETTVLSIETGHQREYGLNPYVRYFESDTLMFPVRPKPNLDGGLRNKDRVIVVRAGSAERVYPVQAVMRAAGQQRWMEDTLGGHAIRLKPIAGAESVVVESVGNPQALPSSVYTFWFAWSAMHPGSSVFAPGAE